VKMICHIIMPKNSIVDVFLILACRLLVPLASKLVNRRKMIA